MHPLTHFLTGWVLAESASLNRRERAAVSLAAVVPDIDGLGYIVERVTLNSANRICWYTDYHHELAHNLLFGLIVALTCLLISARGSPEKESAGVGHSRPLLAGTLGLVAFHLHILGDVAGSRGPDGSQWAIPYLWPFSTEWRWTWSGQWELNAWPNFAVTIVALAITFYLAWRRGYSPLELISKKADQRFVETLRQRV